jgi:hypothetical protein
MDCQQQFIWLLATDMKRDNGSHLQFKLFVAMNANS